MRLQECNFSTGICKINCPCFSFYRFESITFHRQEGRGAACRARDETTALGGKKIIDASSSSPSPARRSRSRTRRDDYCDGLWITWALLLYLDIVGEPFLSAPVDRLMVAPGNITAPDASAACDSYITAPLTASCGAGSCSNATGTPSCICPDGWTGKGDFDFRSLPEQDGDCDKFYPFLRSLYFIGAIAAFLTIFPSFHIMKMAKPKSRKRTSGIMMFTMSIYSAAYFAFRGADPARSIGVDPMVTVLQAIYQCSFWSAGAHVFGTGKLTRWWIVVFGGQSL